MNELNLNIRCETVRLRDYDMGHTFGPEVSCPEVPCQKK